MEYVFAWSGFLGAWLLFAGPIYQASIELREEQLDRTEFEGFGSGVMQDPPPSRWWWLLPPVAYLKRRAWSQRVRAQWMHSIPLAQREKMFSFFNKSTAWLIVGLGAFFIALKETWELVELYDWPGWALALGIVVPTLIATLFTVTRTRMTVEALKEETASAQGEP